MYRLSSNATLFFKIFLPVFWTTIMIGIALVTWFAPEHYFGGVPLQSLRYAVVFTLLMGGLGFFLLFWPLKRVETDGQYVYVSNYFRTARYSWAEDVHHIEESRFLWYRLCWLELNGKGTFGHRIRFLGAPSLLAGFKTAFPGVVQER